MINTVVRGSLKVKADSVEEFVTRAHYSAQESWLRVNDLFGVTLEFAQFIRPLSQSVAETKTSNHLRAFELSLSNQNLGDSVKSIPSVFLAPSASVQRSLEISTNNLDGVNDSPVSYFNKFDSCWHFTERFSFFASDFQGPDSHAIAFPPLSSHLMIVGDESLSLIESLPSSLLIVGDESLSLIESLALTMGIEPLPHLIRIGVSPWTHLEISCANIGIHVQNNQ